MQEKLRIYMLLIIVTIANFACSNLKQDQAKTYVPIDKKLFDTIIYHDSVLFNAFNSRDFDRFKLYFDDSLEIYQDNTGFRNFKQSMEAFNNLFSMDFVLNRELLQNSVEVYPIKNYGAIQTGKHTFCHKENGRMDCGTYKFVHIWRHKDGKWKIIRIITYDHNM